MSPSDIITNPATGRISNTKLAAATAYLVGTGWFCWHNYHSGFLPELWMIYFGVVAGHQTTSKLVALKWGGAGGTTPAPAAAFGAPPT